MKQAAFTNHITKNLTVKSEDIHEGLLVGTTMSIYIAGGTCINIQCPNENAAYLLWESFHSLINHE